MSEVKPEPYSKLEKWLEKLKVNLKKEDASNVEHIHIFYTLLPKVAEGLKTVETMQRSFSWKPASDADQVEGRKITYGLLVPGKLGRYMLSPP